MMKLIVGLGNIGRKYDETPHNAGFMAVDVIREVLAYQSGVSTDDWKLDQEFQAYISKARSGLETRYLYAKPTTMMNLSGRSVRKLQDKMKVDVDDIVLIHDDLDLLVGNYKFQRGVGPKGHNGVNSVESALGRKDFWRLRLGVELEDHNREVPSADYVLHKASANFLADLRETALDALKVMRTTLEF